MQLSKLCPFRQNLTLLFGIKDFGIKDYDITIIPENLEKVSGTVNVS